MNQSWTVLRWRLPFEQPSHSQQTHWTLRVFVPSSTLWRVQICLFYSSAFRQPASFWAFTKSTRQLSELSQMILWTKFWLWKPGLSQSQPSSVTPKDQAKSASAITRLTVTPQRPLHFATACVNFCKWLDHHVWNNWSPGSCSEFWGSLLHAQSLQKR